MVLRTAKKGTNQGHQFWSCSKLHQKMINQPVLRNFKPTMRCLLRAPASMSLGTPGEPFIQPILVILTHLLVGREIEQFIGLVAIYRSSPDSPRPPLIGDKSHPRSIR